ncbi:MULTISPECIES: SRPBCC family protein [Pedobacter]|uniref:Activator of Hsp90 ATPase 1 family protein n=1 Tax=Pedobacter heparinus (strain ATCC 13125 / DSM 2366 / CIP 104194 / JCM 7457 / NBRC 12017 / NCIMB 9290 / NRRL B-14731 / HIM 762-3) TaxID=485917 RepID=C6XSI1_PEDHD|nr:MULTISPECIES: SRPBCC domain-containing protein [Pedobacter]ACU05544.1 Activator of Hsp90 ATPase 1 family protein [Pedobacter heparinus DSM 2366]MBB5440491.1 uncharacterized protein YndB with AHSA1/START domain [Pedobacter sp. AK017]
MKADPFLIERTFNAPVGKVWEAITDTQKMKQWYFDIEAFKPEPGFKFQFLAGDDKKKYLHICKVTEVEEGKKLTYSWSYDNYQGQSWVCFELFGAGTGTRIKLTHTGLDSFPKDDPAFSKESFAAGWTQIIGINLKKFVEQ